MAQWKKGDELKIREGIKESKIGGFPVTVFDVDETTLPEKTMYMVELRDTAMLDGKNTGSFFWILEENLAEVLDDGSEEQDLYSPDSEGDD